MKKIIALCLAVVMTLGLLAGCGKKTDDNTDPSEKTLVLRAETAFTTLDPANSNNTHDIKLYDQIYEGLYGMNEAEGGYYNELAKDVQVSDDSMTLHHHPQGRHHLPERRGSHRFRLRVHL